MLAKEGSLITYFVETILTLCPILAMLLAHWTRDALAPGVLALRTLLAVVLWIGRWRSSPRQDDFVNDLALQAFVRKRFPAGAPALSHYCGELARAGLATPITDLYQYTWLVRTGRIPETDLLVSCI
jgi:hypothetical protein